MIGSGQPGHPFTARTAQFRRARSGFMGKAPVPDIGSQSGRPRLPGPANRARNSPNPPGAIVESLQSPAHPILGSIDTGMSPKRP